MLLIVAAMVPRAGTVALRTRWIGTHVSRNLLHFAGQYFWVYSIGALTLATVFAIEFTMPVWVALLAAVFLGERLRAHRLVQLACGLAGASAEAIVRANQARGSTPTSTRSRRRRSPDRYELWA